MAQYSFGAGILSAVPLLDGSGNAIANPTPVKFGELQDVSVDISFDTKVLNGNLQFPVAVGRGKGKISCKASMARINGPLYNALFFGQTLAAGQELQHFEIAGAVVPATPFQITVTAPSSGTYGVDLGVRDQFGVGMKRVASSPAAGEYSVTGAGVYTFADADTGKEVFIDYQYSLATGSTIEINNLPMGQAPSFKAILSTPYQGKNMTMVLNNCVTSKFGFSTKQDDFNMPELDWECFADPNGRVGTISTTE